MQACSSSGLALSNTDYPVGCNALSRRGSLDGTFTSPLDAAALDGELDPALVTTGAVDVAPERPIVSDEVVRGRPPDLLMISWHRDAISFMHPRTLRSAVLARMNSCGPRSPNVAGGRPRKGARAL